MPPTTGEHADTRRDARSAGMGAIGARSDRWRVHDPGVGEGFRSAAERRQGPAVGAAVFCFLACLSEVDGLGALQKYASQGSRLRPPDEPARTTRWDRSRARAVRARLPRDTRAAPIGYARLDPGSH